MLGIGLGVGVLLYTLVLLAGAAVWPGFRSLLEGAELDDWLKVITMVAGWLSVLGLLGKALFQWTREAQTRIHHWLMALFIAWRTYVPWDRVIRQQERKSARETEQQPC